MEEITQSRAQDTLVREVGSQVGPGDPHHHLEQPEGGAGGGFVLRHIEDDIREDRPGHGVAGGVSWSCLTGLLCLRNITSGGVRPPIRSLSLNTTGVYHHSILYLYRMMYWLVNCLNDDIPPAQSLQYPLEDHPGPLTDQQARQEPHAHLPPPGHQQGEHHQEGQSWLS